jgi:hypothetical protein
MGRAVIFADTIISMESMVCILGMVFAGNITKQKTLDVFVKIFIVGIKAR